MEDHGMRPETEAQLDRMLSLWADDKRLSSACSEEVQRVVLGTPPSPVTPAYLDYEWWQSLSALANTALSLAGRYHPATFPERSVFGNELVGVKGTVSV
jgi:hypothetical protein